MTYNSVYEITNNLTTIAGQHMIEYFTGNSLDSRWTLSDINGGTSGAMSDEIDGGYKVSFSTSAAAWGGLTFNNAARPFDLENFSCIMTMKRTFASSSGGYWAGMSNVINTTQNDTVAFASNSPSKSNFSLYLKGTTTSNTESDLTVDDNWHTGKLESRPSSVKLSIDGVLKVTVGSGMGSVIAQPSITAIDNSTDAGNSFSVNYYEAWNT